MVRILKEITVFATDIHGDLEFYQRLLDLALEKKAKYVIIGGDITPLEFLNSLKGIQGQVDFLELQLIPLIKEFKDKSRSEVFIMPGNDDYSFIVSVLEKAEINGILKFIHNRVHKLGSRFIAGYSFINPTPFMFKEWEKTEDELKTDLLVLCSKSNTRKMIFSVHAPPFNTKLDVLYDGTHVGSVAVREFLEQKQPYLGLHGHIHESPDVSGDFKDTIGKTLVLNPGSKTPVVFDLNNLKKIERVNI